MLAVSTVMKLHITLKILIRARIEKLNREKTWTTLSLLFVS